MKTIITLCLAALLTVTAPLFAAEVAKMDKDELKNRLGSEELVLIDVRAGRDWTSSQFKIKGALREDPDAVADWAGKYDKSKTIVLYCA